MYTVAYSASFMKNPQERILFLKIFENLTFEPKVFKVFEISALKNEGFQRFFLG